eukprot:683570-Rhodomonas_salina.1
MKIKKTIILSSTYFNRHLPLLLPHEKYRVPGYPGTGYPGTRVHVPGTLWAPKQHYRFGTFTRSINKFSMKLAVVLTQ